MEDLPAPWVRRQSRTRRAPYAFNPVTSETAWLEDDAGAALLAGWGWREADPTRPDGGGRVYVHLATGATRAGPPSESDAAAADGEGATGVGGGRLEPQRAPAPLLAGVGAGGEPAEGNVLFDVFSPAFRSREPWRFAQLGLATAAVEVAWWEAIAAGMGRRAADRAAAAAAANTDAQDVTAPRLIAAAVRALGPKRFADGWDPRRRAYVVQREAVPGEDRSDPPPGAGAKRARHDAADAEPASGGAAGPPRLQLRDPADFAVAPGGSLFTDPRFPCNAVAAGVYASGRVRGRARGGGGPLVGRLGATPPLHGGAGVACRRLLGGSWRRRARAHWVPATLRPLLTRPHACTHPPIHPSTPSQRARAGHHRLRAHAAHLRCHRPPRAPVPVLPGAGQQARPLRGGGHGQRAERAGHLPGAARQRRRWDRAPRGRGGAGERGPLPDE